MIIYHVFFSGGRPPFSGQKAPFREHRASGMFVPPFPSCSMFLMADNNSDLL